jgi:ribosome-associated protein
MSARDDMSRRQIARHDTKLAGDRSAELARELMKMNDTMVAKLEMSEEVHAEIVKARAVKSLNARRRAERTLAAVLRAIDLKDLRARIAAVRATGSVDSERLHLAEKWRARLLDEGPAASEAFCAGEVDHALPGLIAQALRERTSGKPPGAGRALFRHIAEVLKGREAGVGDADEAGADDDGDDAEDANDPNDDADDDA